MCLQRERQRFPPTQICISHDPLRSSNSRRLLSQTSAFSAHCIYIYTLGILGSVAAYTRAAAARRKTNRRFVLFFSPLTSSFSISPLRFFTASLCCLFIILLSLSRVAAGDTQMNLDYFNSPTISKDLLERAYLVSLEKLDAARVEKVRQARKTCTHTHTYTYERKSRLIRIAMRSPGKNPRRFEGSACGRVSELVPKNPAARWRSWDEREKTIVRQKERGIFYLRS